jgi:hypothetical protein
MQRAQGPTPRTLTGDLLLLRNHEELARYAAHPNYSVCCADGLVAFRDGRGYTRLVDVTASFPQEPVLGPKNLRWILDRKRGLVMSDPRYPIEAPDGSTPVGLLVVSLPAGEVLERWAITEALPSIEPREVQLFATPPQSSRPPDKPIWEDVPELVLAPDGETWALIADQRIAVGRRGQALGQAFWTSRQLYRPRVRDSRARRDARPGPVGLPVCALWYRRAGHPDDVSARPPTSRGLSPFVKTPRALGHCNDPRFRAPSIRLGPMERALKIRRSIRSGKR